MKLYIQDHIASLIIRRLIFIWFIFVFTYHKNDRFQMKLFAHNTKIWISAPINYEACYSPDIKAANTSLHDANQGWFNRTSFETKWVTFIDISRWGIFSYGAFLKILAFETSTPSSVASLDNWRGKYSYICVYSLRHYTNNRPNVQICHCTFSAIACMARNPWHNPYYS